MNRNFLIDKQQAEAHLSLIDEASEKFLFYTLDDVKTRKSSKLKTVIYSTLEKALPKLQQFNDDGAGIFVCVNETSGQERKTQDITRLRAVWIEMDRPGAKTPSLEPHFVIESSPGKFHYYFLIDNAPIEIGRWEAVQQRLVDDYASDPNAKDRSRILRLAGTWHRKSPDKPYQVNICQQNGGLPYQWEKLIQLIPPLEKRKPVSIVQSGDKRKLPEIRSALRCLDPDCDYQDWLSIGMAIHQATEGGQAGLDVWDCWSSEGMLYRPGETQYRWKTFQTQGNSSGQITVTSLFAKANKNGWDRKITAQDAGLPDDLNLIKIDKLPISAQCKQAIQNGGDIQDILIELLNNKVNDDNILSILMDQRHGIAVESLKQAETELVKAKEAREKPICEARLLFDNWDKNDAGFPFEPTALDAMLLLHEQSTSDFERIKSEFRKAKISLRNFDKALKEHKQSRTRNAIADGTHPVQNPQKQQSWPYTIENQAITWNKTTDNGVIIPIELCNFSAKIERQIIHDDGAEERGSFDISGQLRSGRRLPSINVPLLKFSGMTWITANWGNQPIVNAGQSVKDHLRCAIQKLSGEPEKITIYGHIGWKKIDGAWCYLHHGGSLSATNNDASIRVDVDGGGAMHRYKLPDLDGNKIEAIQTSLKILNSVPDQPDIGYLLLGTTYRAPTYQCHRIDQVTFISGKTGAGKSELTALMLGHYGEFTARDFPSNWEDSPTDMEMKAHHAKDAIFVIDDFKPVGGKSGVEKLHAKADRILRGAGNQAGRGRRSATLEARPSYYPRGFLVSTGEDIPRGESLRARMVIAEVKQGDIDFDVITEMQQAAANGLLQSAMSGYIQWLAPQIDQLTTKLKETITEYRQTDNLQFSHRRGVDNYANLMMGVRLFAQYAFEHKAIDEQQKQQILTDAEKHLSRLMDKQAEFLQDCDEVSRFLNLLRTAFNTGRAHVSNRENGPPFSTTAHFWGWKIIEEGNGKKLQPLGDRIGWILDDYICLDPEAAFTTTQRLASEQHQPFDVTQRTLWRRLRDKGLIVVNQDNAKNESRHTVKRSIAGKKQNVIQLPFYALDESSHSSQFQNENNEPGQAANFSEWQDQFEKAS